MINMYPPQLAVWRINKQCKGTLNKQKKKTKKSNKKNRKSCNLPYKNILNYTMQPKILIQYLLILPITKMLTSSQILQLLHYHTILQLNVIHILVPMLQKKLNTKQKNQKKKKNILLQTFIPNYTSYNNTCKDGYVSQ